MFPPKTKKPAVDPMALEEEGLNDLKGFAEDGMAQEILARLGLAPEGEAPPEGMDAAPGVEALPPVEDVPGMDPSTEAPAEGADGLDMEKLKRLLESMA